MEKITLRFLAGLLVVLLLCGCGAIPAEPDSGEQIPTESAVPGIRYPVEWASDAVIYEVNVRQYTEEGTFKAFAENLQTLKDMGITTLWFMPIHPISETKRSGVLGSYYSITDYRAVNPEFGTAEDFKALVDKAHDMGFTVMMDWVANHTGWDCAWIKEHPDWYTKGPDGEITDPIGMGWPDVADLNYDNKELWAEMIDCMAFWVREFDVDGFRCDYANGVPREFWETARAELNQIKPLLMLAEDNKEKGLLEEAFDLNYNWELYDAMISIAEDKSSVRYMKPYLYNEGYPEGTFRLNFLDNHDKNSWEKTVAEAFGYEKLPCFFTMLYTVPGIPLIYTGDEIGLDHNIAFMEKDPIDWESSPVSYRELLAELAAIRRENPALHAGNYGGELKSIMTGCPTVLSFSREVAGNTIVCVFNLVKRETHLNMGAIVDGTETILLHGYGEDILEMEDTSVPEDLLTKDYVCQPWEFWILRK